MPMLPSGRHVAIIRDSLHELLDNAEIATNVHKVLAIHEKTDLHAFTEVLWLLPQGQASQEQVDAAFLDESLPRPAGLIPVKSGYCLSQSAEFAADWSDEDKAAFWEFINVRADHLFDESLKLTLEVQNYLRTKSVGTTKLLVAWWDAGVHPVQEEAPVQEGELPVWDDYDMLAAIGQMRSHMQTMQLTGRLLDDRMRESAIWSRYAHDVRQLHDWPDLASPTRVAAQIARAGHWLNTLSAIDRATMHRQCVYECVALWDHFGPQLETDYAEPYEILNLVVISPEGGDYFNR
ncbi:MAG: hypothetical protein ACYCZ6_06315 [Polaromonas sp.]